MATPQMTPDQMPRTAGGYVKMVNTKTGAKEAVHPDDVQTALQTGYRLPTQAELGVSSPSGPSGGANPQPPLSAPPQPSPKPAVPPPTGGPIGTDPTTGQPHDGSAYAKVLTQQADPQDILTPALTRMGVPGGVISTLKGMAKSGGKTAVNTASMIGLHPTDAERQSTEYSNPTEKVAGIGTDIAMALAPGGAATKLSKAASLGKAGTTALRILLNAGGSGLVNKMQGGDFKTGAMLGGAGEGVATGVTAMAPKLLKSVIPGVDNATAQTLLKNTSGLKPASIAASAGQVAPQIVEQMEQAAGHVSQPVSTKGALKVVDDAMKKAVNGNDTETMQHLRTVRQRLLNTTVPGAQAKPTEALHIANTLDDLSESLPSNANTSYGPAEVAGKARDALNDSIDAVAPGHRTAHDTVRQLIQGGKAAKDAAKNQPGLVANMARHAITLLSGGGVYGASHSLPGALAAGAVSHAITSPVTRVAASRVAASPITPQLLNMMKAAMMQGTQPGQPGTTPPGQPNMLPPQ
jgi:hypothetical protein